MDERHTTLTTEQGITNSLKARYYKQTKARDEQRHKVLQTARDEKRYKVLQTARDETILFQVRWAFPKGSATWAGRRYRGRWQSGQEHKTCFGLFVHFTILPLMLISFFCCLGCLCFSS